MTNIASNYEWLVKENVFGFLRSYLMAFPVLFRIVFVPVEPRAIPQRITRGHSALVYDYRIQRIRSLAVAAQKGGR